MSAKASQAIFRKNPVRLSFTNEHLNKFHSSLRYVFVSASRRDEKGEHTQWNMKPNTQVRA